METRPRIAVLVDLPRGKDAGGHVKYWERLAGAYARREGPVDLTVYFSGPVGEEFLAPHVRFRALPPVFSSARVPFLPYVPAHTDLAPFHPALARELASYDVLHATDGFFAFARTAERVARRRGIPLVSSFHTDTPAYTEVFTRRMLGSLLGKKLGGGLDRRFGIAARARRSKERRLVQHLAACSVVMALRDEDRLHVRRVLDGDRVRPMRLGVDKDLFAPQDDVREALLREHSIDPEAFVVLFVGRVDEGKNVPLLLQACCGALAAGVNVHLVMVGAGPMMGEARQVLGNKVTLTGQISAEALARFYVVADSLLMVSEIEIGGFVGLEALACGCPVLAAAANGAADFYDAGDAVVSVAGDAGAWTCALVSLAENVAQQKRMREAARAFRREKLVDWDAVLTEDFLPVWRRVLDEKGV